MPAESPLRAVRAALFAAICVLLALIGHMSMSDAPIPWWAPTVAFGVLAGAAWAAAARERGLIAIGTGVLIAQGALHSLFTVTASITPAAGGPTSDQIEAQWLRLLLCNDDVIALNERQWSAARLLESMRLDPALALKPPSSHGTHAMAGGHDMGAMSAGQGHGMSHMPLHGDTGMLLLHLLAALGCALWLRRGEKAVFGLVRLFAARASGLVTLLRAAVGAPRVPTAAPHACTFVRATLTPPRWAHRPLMRRGPPIILV